MDETSALIPYDGDPALTPDAILSGPVRLAGEHDPEAARRRAREQVMAIENILASFAVAIAPLVGAMAQATASWGEAAGRCARQFAEAASTPQTRALARSVEDAPRHPTRYERRMARVATTPRRKKRNRGRR